MLLQFIRLKVLNLNNYDEIMDARKIGVDEPNPEESYRYRNIRREYIVSVDEDHDDKGRTIITLINGDSLVLDMCENDVMSLINEGVAIGQN